MGFIVNIDGYTPRAGRVVTVEGVEVTEHRGRLQWREVSLRKCCKADFSGSEVDLKLWGDSVI